MNKVVMNPKEIEIVNVSHEEKRTEGICSLSISAETVITCSKQVRISISTFRNNKGMIVTGIFSKTA